MDKVGRRVEAVRRSAGLGKVEFAKAIGIDPSSYSKIIKGEKPLKPEAAYAIYSLWGVSLDFIYAGRLESLPVATLRRIQGHMKGDLS